MHNSQCKALSRCERKIPRSIPSLFLSHSTVRVMGEMGWEQSVTDGMGPHGGGQRDVVQRKADALCPKFLNVHPMPSRENNVFFLQVTVPYSPHIQRIEIVQSVGKILVACCERFVTVVCVVAAALCCCCCWFVLFVAVVCVVVVAALCCLLLLFVLLLMLLYVVCCCCLCCCSCCFVLFVAVVCVVAAAALCCLFLPLCVVAALCCLLLLFLLNTEGPQVCKSMW